MKESFVVTIERNNNVPYILNICAMVQHSFVQIDTKHLSRHISLCIHIKSRELRSGTMYLNMLSTAVPFETLISAQSSTCKP